MNQVIEFTEVESLQIQNILHTFRDQNLKAIEIAKRESYFKDQERFQATLKVVENLLKLFGNGNV